MKAIQIFAIIALLATLGNAIPIPMRHHFDYDSPRFQRHFGLPLTNDTITEVEHAHSVRTVEESPNYGDGLSAFEVKQCRRGNAVFYMNQPGAGNILVTYVNDVMLVVDPVNERYVYFNGNSFQHTYANGSYSSFYDATGTLQCFFDPNGSFADEISNHKNVLYVDNCNGILNRWFGMTHDTGSCEEGMAFGTITRDNRGTISVLDFGTGLPHPAGTDAYGIRVVGNIDYNRACLTSGASWENYFTLPSECYPVDDPGYPTWCEVFDFY